MTNADTPTIAKRPNNVPQELVRDFDFYAIPGADEDVQAAFREVQKSSPDIFWTPRNGGHWVATRAEDIIAMQRDYKHFSSKHIQLPLRPSLPRQVPIELDPPEHGLYRRALTQALMPSIVAKLETNVRKVAIEAIEKVFADKQCEFVRSFAKVLPIHVFLELVQIPLDDKDYLLDLTETIVRGRTGEIQLNAHFEMQNYLQRWIRERRDNPGDDLLSRVVNVEIGGERISEFEATLYATVVLSGGLDTVAGMIAFIALFLARNPEHRRQLVERLDDEEFLANAIEELIRRHGLANLARLIVEDMDYKGIRFREGDHIFPANLWVGMDDRVNKDPLTVDFERKNPVHAVFGNGPHVCPGAVLARREVRIFLKEWLSRIPDFRIKPGTKPVMETGLVNGVVELELEWD